MRLEPSPVQYHLMKRKLAEKKMSKEDEDPVELAAWKAALCGFVE